jgi:tRNA pseudouridine55 synthase
MATGVLVVGFGRATRLLPYLQTAPKEYTATIRLGLATSTDDAAGEPLGTAVPVTADMAAIDVQLSSMVGEVLQRPSSVSAIKVDGRRAYARVRSGEQVRLEPRPVRIDRLERTSPPRPAPDGGLDVEVLVACGSGTYVRAVARDLGESLGCGGHLTGLRRTAVGAFRAGGASVLPPPGAAPPAILTPAQAACAVLPVVRIDAAGVADALSGRRVACPAGTLEGPVALLGPDGSLVAVAETVDGTWHYRMVLAATGPAAVPPAAAAQRLAPLTP